MADQDQVWNSTVDQSEATGDGPSLFQDPEEERNGTRCCIPEPLSDPEAQAEIGTQTKTNHIVQIPTTVEEDTRPIVVTGFGPIGHGDEDNISQLVMQDFYDSRDRYFEDIKILTGTDSMMKDHRHLVPVETSYDFVTSECFDSWLRKTDAQLFVHLGTTPNGYGNPILFEFQACNGYVSDPGWWQKDSLSIHTPRYQGECVRGEAEYLHTSINISQVIERVKEKVAIPRDDNGVDLITLEASCDAGTFLCDFLYYRSLYYRSVYNAKERDDGTSTRQKVIFIHVPETLNDRVTVPNITDVLAEIVRCLLDAETDPDITPPCACLRKIANREIGNGIKTHDPCCIRKQAPMKKEADSVFDHSPTLNGCQNSAPRIDENSQASGLDQTRYHVISHRPPRNGTSVDHQCPNQQDMTSSPFRSLSPTKVVTMPTIVVTGFGPIYKSPNLSWQAVKAFYTSQKELGVFQHGRDKYRLLAGPPDKEGQPTAIDTTFEFVSSLCFNSWLKSTNARLYVHFGIDGHLNETNGIGFENQACNGHDGYWTTPDKHRKTYHQRCVEEDKEDEYRHSQFTDQQIKDLVDGLPAIVKAKHINGSFSFQKSCDAGHFLCDFLYYRSLYYTETRANQTDSDEKSYVIFVHIPSSMNVMDSISLRSNLPAIKPMSLVIEVIVHALLDIIS